MTEVVLGRARKIYTPGQVAFGAFLGGILTASYLVYRNNDYFEANSRNKFILLVGLVLLVGMSVAKLVYGYDITSVSLGMAFVMYIYVKIDISRHDIKDEELDSVKQSWFNVIVMTLGLLLISVFILFAKAVLLNALGIINLEAMK